MEPMVLREQVFRLIAIGVGMSGLLIFFVISVVVRGMHRSSCVLTEIQGRSNDCGVAALKMVLDRHGITNKVIDLEKGLNLTKEGASMLMLQTVAAKRGLKGRGVRLKESELLTMPLPAILFFQPKHFVVLQEVRSADEVVIGDPAWGTRILSRAVLSASWRGEAIVFEDSNSCRHSEIDGAHLRSLHGNGASSNDGCGERQDY
jgi:ABC-type bacteriocin/lantibiotic exporter with double-glycine peptidase domain